MLRILLAGVCALLATGCPPPQPCTPNPGGPLPPPGGAGVALVFGDSSPVDLSFSVATASCPDAVNAERAEVEVLGPTNRQVQHTLTFLGASSPGAAAVAQVTFTPPMPGYYHVMVTFLPVGGRAQRDLLVVHDRELAPTRILNRPCTRTLFATDGGLLLCGGAAVNGANVTTSTFANDATSTEQVVAKGNTAWVYPRWFDSRALSRFVVIGDSVVDRPDASVEVQGLRALFPVDDHHVVGYATSALALDARLLLIRSDGGVTERSAPNEPEFSGTRVTGIVRPPWFYFGSPTPSANPELKGSNTRVCAYSLDPSRFGDPDGGACWPIVGEAMGAGRDGIFTWSDETKTLRLASPEGADGGLVVVDALTLSTDFQARPPSLDVLSRDGRLTFSARLGASEAVFVPRRQDNHIVLDRYRSISTLNAAQDEFVWTNSSSGAELWPTHP